MVGETETTGAGSLTRPRLSRPGPLEARLDLVDDESDVWRPASTMAAGAGRKWSGTERDDLAARYVGRPAVWLAGWLATTTTMTTIQLVVGLAGRLTTITATMSKTRRGEARPSQAGPD